MTRLATILATLVAALCLAACGDDEEAGGSGGSGASGGGGETRSAIYVSTNPRGTNGFLRLIAQGLEQGGRDCGVQTRVVESTDPTSLQNNLRAAAQQRPDLIVANSFDSVQAIEQLSRQFPEQRWALVDAAVEGNDRVQGILFREHEGMYLVGAAFGLLASGEYDGFPRSSTVGFVGAVDNPVVRRFSNGFEQGVEAEGDGARVVTGFGSSFNDPATSKELALAQRGRGARYVAGAAAAGNSGVYEAAAERDFLTSSVDIDERERDPEHIVISMVKRSDQPVREAVCSIADGSFRGGPRDFGVAEDAVGPEFLVLPEGELSAPSRLPEPVQQRLRELKDRIASGELTVEP